MAEVKGIDSDSFAREVLTAQLSCAVGFEDVENLFYDYKNEAIDAYKVNDVKEAKQIIKNMKILAKNYIKNVKDGDNRKSIDAEIHSDFSSEVNEHLEDIKILLVNNKIDSFLLEFHPEGNNYNSHIQYTGHNINQAIELIKNYVDENELSVKFITKEKKEEVKDNLDDEYLSDDFLSIKDMFNKSLENARNTIKPKTDHVDKEKIIEKIQNEIIEKKKQLDNEIIQGKTNDTTISNIINESKTKGRFRHSR